MNRRWIIPGVLLLLALAGCSRTKGTEQEGKLFVSGRIDGDTVDISSKRDGKIVEIMAREGDSVEAGQLLARIYSLQDEAQVDAQKANVGAQRANVIEAERELEQAESAAPARVALAEANLATSQAELVRCQAEQQQAEIDAQRYPPLVKTGAAAAQMSEQQQTKVKVAQASTDAAHKQVLAAEASLNQAKAQLQQIATAKANLAGSQAQLTSNQAQLRRFEANVGDLEITAPIAGTILTRSAEPGRVIAAGQTILTMVDLHKLYLRGFIPEGDVGKVKVGQQAQVYLDSNPKDAIAADVIRIDPQVMFTPENTYFKDDRVKQVMGVKLGLKGGYGFAKPGMPADGQIQMGNP
jgi:HlyD family secretion protein